MNSMKSIRNILAIATFILSIVPLFAQPDEKTINFLKSFRSGYISGMISGNYSSILTGYAENVRLMPEFQKTIVGKDNAAKYYVAFTKRYQLTAYTRSEGEVLDLGSRVLEIGAFTTTMKIRSTRKEHQVRGKYMDIWQKDGTGSLSLVTQAWNYDHPVDIADGLRFSEVPVTDVASRPHVPVANNISFELAGLNMLMEATVSQHDAKIWSQFYSTDGVFMYSNHPIYRGKKSVDEFLEKHIKDLPVFEKLDIRNDQIDDLGNYVIEYASHTAIWRGGEYSGVNTGKDLRVWKREKNGSLKILRHIGMYD